MENQQHQAYGCTKGLQMESDTAYDWTGGWSLASVQEAWVRRTKSITKSRLESMTKGPEDMLHTSPSTTHSSNIIEIQACISIQSFDG